jgi:hypothetical protein
VKYNLLTAVLAIATIACGGLATAQEEMDSEQAEYQHLKVLEPMVGNYHAEWTNDEAGEKWETELTISWNDSKNMLIVESKNRALEPATNRPKSDWIPFLRQYFVWNHQEKRMELIDVRAWSGTVDVSEVAAKGNGVFAYSMIRTTGRPGGQGDVTMTATEHDLTAKIINIRTPDGESLDDMEFRFQRVKQ